MGGIGRGEVGAAEEREGVKAIVSATTAERENNEIFILGVCDGKLSGEELNEQSKWANRVVI